MEKVDSLLDVPPGKMKYKSLVMTGGCRPGLGLHSLGNGTVLKNQESEGKRKLLDTVLYFFIVHSKISFL